MHGAGLLSFSMCGCQDQTVTEWLFIHVDSRVQQLTRNEVSIPIAEGKENEVHCPCGEKALLLIVKKDTPNKGSLCVLSCHVTVSRLVTKMSWN